MAKGQVWMSDFTIAIVIFIIILIAYFLAASNLSSFGRSQSDLLYGEATGITELLLQPPSANTTVAITDGKHRIIDTEVARIALIDYEILKRTLNVKHEFLLFFEDSSGQFPIGGVNQIGKIGVIADQIIATEDPNTLISVRRLAITGEKAVSLVVYVWQ